MMKNLAMITEALAIGFKEGLKIWLLWLVFRAWLVLNKKGRLLLPFWCGLALAVGLSAAFFVRFEGMMSKEVIGNIAMTSFAFFFFAGAAALQGSGTELFGKVSAFFQRDEGAFIAGAVVFSASFLFFLPDGMGTVSFLRDLAALKSAVMMTYVSVFSGLLLTTTLLLFAGKFLKPSRIGAFFDLPQMLLFLSMVKLLGGGTNGIAEITLIPSVQRGLMKFVHDIIHQIFVILMVPDHLLLKTTVWNFIAIFFGPNFASVAALFLLLLLPFLFLYRSLCSPLPEEGALAGPKQRIKRYLLLSDRRKKALPVLCFIGLILFSWFSESGEPVSRLYEPAAKPVVDDSGTVLIPLHDPTMDLTDGMLHKFSLAYKEEIIKIIVIRKANTDLAVCLDACEVCPPRGYGHREDHVVCIYCNTPIPVDTLGRTGGCNPIPLRFSVDERFLRIETGEILNKWEDVKKNTGKEMRK